MTRSSALVVPLISAISVWSVVEASGATEYGFVPPMAKSFTCGKAGSLLSQSPVR